MYEMLNRFYEIRLHVASVLGSEGLTAMYPTEHEIDIIKDLVEALEIVEAGTRNICARDVNLAVADEVCHLKDHFKFKRM